MPFTHIQFQEVAIECLRRGMEEKRLAHAWLFFGPQGVGKRLAAQGVCEALLCEEGGGGRCGGCLTCRRIKQRTHPDVTWMASERSQVERGWLDAKTLSRQPSQEVHVEQIRQLKERLHIRALEGKHKVAVILDAHEMNLQAQNALLKVLEEPPAGTFLLLTADRKERLLSTLRSRCQLLAFKPLPLAFVAERLLAAGIEEGKALRIAEAAEGSLGRAERLGQGWLEFEEEIEAAFFKPEAGVLGELLGFAERYGGSRGEAERCLEALLRLLARRAKALARGGGKEQQLGRWLYAYERAEEAKVAIVQRNGAPRLQMEAMLLDIFAEPVGL